MAENLGLQVEVSANIKPLTKGLADARKELASTATAAVKTDSSIGKLSVGLSSFGNVASSVKSQVAGFASSLASGGIIAGVTLAGIALFELGKNLAGLTEQQKRFNSVIDESKGAYVKAVLEVDKMRDAFANAKAGLISKENALKLYNSTIGKTIGQTNNLDIAEKNFIANAENYIKFTLYKAAANKALEKAAEAAFNAETAKTKTASRGILEAYVPQAELKRRREIAALKEQTEFQEIYNELIKKANTFGFNRLEQEVKIPTIKVKPEKIQILKPRNPDASVEAGALDNLVIPRFSIGSGIGEIGADAGKEIAIGIGAGIKDTIETGGIADNLSSATNTLSLLLSDAMKDVAVDAGETIGNVFADLATNKGNGLDNLFAGLFNSVGAQIQALGKFLIRSAIQVKIAKEAFKKLLDKPVLAIAVGIGLIALGAALKSAAKQQFKGFALGGRNIAGGVALVGERGPELVNLPKGSDVIPNSNFNNIQAGAMEVYGRIVAQGTELAVIIDRARATNRRNN